MTPELHRLYAVCEATWPPAATHRAGPWTIREGRGGGQRVSAATAEGPVTEANLPMAETKMRALGQTPQFMIRAGEEALDALLAKRGYALVDPVDMWLGPAAPLTETPLPRACTFTVWEPLAIQIDLWADGGIGPGRIAVMERVAGLKTSIIARDDHTPAGTAFVALHDRIAMIHALEVPAPCRRKGMARLICRQAAFWAVAQGGTHVAALCTRANAAAGALYPSLGMGVVGQYHYRKAKDDTRG